MYQDLELSRPLAPTWMLEFGQAGGEVFIPRRA